ncbi:hypothetical protein PCANC_11550 [Puccinia coronata f. sp. avenae]|uniref:Uncharacterized protein n=1 Tax=Puccinia coronata f. sp. avenae TaxID=200324 RepID=A0A2N5UQU2_9BASI|nr:hypothetical protein PCANC_11550 [Puccinia coronata f. sp. avenae]
MKATIAGLLLIVMEVSMRFVAGMDWESFEDYGRFCFDNWSGEEHQKLLQAICQSTPPSGPYHPHPTPSHTSAPTLTTPGHPTSEVTDPGHLNFLHIEPVISNSPVRSFQNSPANVAHETLEGLPSGSSREAQVDAASENVQVAAKSPGQVKNRKRKMPTIFPPNMSLLDCIQMNEKEALVHQLVFDKKVFKWPSHDAPNSSHRAKTIEDSIDKRIAEGHSDLPVLVIKSANTHNILEVFSANPTARDVETQVAADAGLRSFFDFVEIWIAVYEKRLGIDFEASLGWIRNTLRMSPAMITNIKLIKKMNHHFVAYIFFIDTIITILSQPTGVAVDRMQAFRTAVNCFEQFTKITIRDKNLLSKIKKLNLLWMYISYWITHDRQYQSKLLVSSSSSKGYEIWKSIFNFILAYSVDSLNERSSLHFPNCPIKTRVSQKALISPGSQETKNKKA